MLDIRSESGFLTPSGFIEEEPLNSEEEKRKRERERGEGYRVSPVTLTDLSVCLSLSLRGGRAWDEAAGPAVPELGQ